jgi:signal peptidase I
MIEQLIHEEKELLAKISENRNKQRDYYTALFCEKYKVKIGDTIKFKDGKDTLTGVIDHFEYSGVKPNYPIVLLINNDGKVGKREKRCWWSALETIEVVQSA